MWKGLPGRLLKRIEGTARELREVQEQLYRHDGSGKQDWKQEPIN
jgi:hypothetical protein